MTREELRSWIKRRRLSHEQAAFLLAISVSELRKKLYGAVKVGEQTAKITELSDKLAESEERLELIEVGLMAFIEQSEL